MKLRQCLYHIDELEVHKAEIKQEIFCLSDKYEEALTLMRTVPGFDKNPMAAIHVLSETRGGMCVSPQLKTSFHGLDAVSAMTKAIKKSNPLGFPALVLILNQFWCKLQTL